MKMKFKRSIWRRVEDTLRRHGQEFYVYRMHSCYSVSVKPGIAQGDLMEELAQIASSESFSMDVYEMIEKDIIVFTQKI